VLTKKLVFTLGLLFFLLSNISLYVFKVDELPFKISYTEIQALMDSKFYVKDTSEKTGVTYEILDPTVELLDDAHVAFTLDLTLTANPEVEWGKVKFVSEVHYNDKKHRLDLVIPDQAELIVLGKSSNNADFNLWNKDIKTLVSDVTVSINKHLAKYIIYALKGPELRVQAEYYSLKSVTKHANALDVVLNVHQGINIFILYMVMALSVITFACGYFFVGGVAGFKDPDDKGFHDPRAFAKRRRAGDRDRAAHEKEHHED
jgi:hypothetical protein